MNTWYVMVIAPMDCGFVGPFESRDTAMDWVKQQTHDCVIMTESEMRDNIDEYGEPDYITKS